MIEYFQNKIKLISKICEGDVKLNNDKNQTKYLRTKWISQQIENEIYEKKEIKFLT